MKSKIYISPSDLSGIKAVTELGNTEPFEKYLDSINYHFLLFSTLYQSGANLFYIDKEHMPKSLLEHPFWENKFLEISEKKYYSAKVKAIRILENNFDKELDKQHRAPQYSAIIEHFTSLFYSVNENIPFLNTQFVNKNDFDFLETRLSKELFNSIGNFYSLIKSDQIQTICPQYSVMKKDVKRFEDIASNSIFDEYNESLKLLEYEKKPEKLIKKIKVKSTQIYNRYSSSLDIKSMTFSLLKTNKKVIDLFTNKATSIIGDFGIEFLEKILDSKSKVHYYDSKENYILRLWTDRINEMYKAGGKDEMNNYFDKLK